MKNKGRKIPPHLENPIDNILIDLCDRLIPFINATPNQITIFRLILGIIFIYKLNCRTNKLFTILFIIFFYFLDCLDGHLARKTNQVTIIGDYLDHISDIIFIIGLLKFIISKKYKNKNEILIILIIFFYLSFVHLGLQQKNYKLNNKKTNNELLDNLNKIHSLSYEHIKWTRYFGTGTLMFILIIIINYIQRKCQ